MDTTHSGLSPGHWMDCTSSAWAEIWVLWLLASSRNTLLPCKDVVSHLICMTLCKIASVKMRWDYVLLGTTWAQRELLNRSTLLPSSFFFRATCPSPPQIVCAWIWIKTNFRRKNVFIYLYKTNSTRSADQPFPFSFSRAIQATFQCSQPCGC